MDDYTPQEIKKIRQKVIDYYGSATPFFASATADLVRVESMSDDEIVEEAKKLNII